MPRQLYQIWNREKTRKFQKMLLDWYSEHKRKFPWRNRPEPYRVWISEIMLQQTQAQTVLPYYERFLDRFPDVQRLAAAPEREVVGLWAGLGYYNRARNLHRAAKIIVQEYRGIFPDSLKAILKLPGVGRYTAGAIHSIAFNQPQPIVDGNVRRVICRLHGIEGRAKERFFWDQASAWIPEGQASDFNQAMMELGALICIPSAPLCLLCPVQSLCQARRRGIQTDIPPPRVKRAAEAVRLVMLVLEQNGRILMVRQHDAGYIPGEWGMPTQSLRDLDEPAPVARRLARKVLRCPVRLEARSPVRHSITYRKLLIHVFHGKLVRSAGAISDKENVLWAPASNLNCYLTSSAFRKALRGSGLTI